MRKILLSITILPNWGQMVGKFLKLNFPHPIPTMYGAQNFPSYETSKVVGFGMKRSESTQEIFFLHSINLTDFNLILLVI